MKPIKSFLERWGIHSLLLAVFFILRSYNQYYGLVSNDVTIKIFLRIILISVIVCVLLFAITKDLNKSLQLTTLSGAITLFYGVIKDFFQQTLRADFLSKYSVLLPLLLLGTVILIRLISKKKDFRKTNLFQNILLIIFILIEGIVHLVNHGSFFLSQKSLTNFHLAADSLPEPASRPDVYYLVFDSYPGTRFLKDYMKYDNSLFDEALREKGFYVLKDPKSNYKRTAFSISSTLNFEYFQGIKSSSRISSKNYNQAMLTTRESIVPKVFEQHGYRFYNLSVFDIGNTASIHKESFLTMPEEDVLLYNTLPGRLKKDLLWNLVTGKHAIPFIQKIFKRNEEKFIAEQLEKKNFNITVVDSLMKLPFQKKEEPKFIYAHLYLPHPPFFYNEKGEPNDPTYVITEKAKKDKTLFLSYLAYTNKIILEIVQKIKHAGDANCLIIIQSDHGFTDFEGGPADTQLFFKNYSAFYFHDKNYSALYDDMSNINTFPVVFNKYFGTKIPLRPDSSVYLSY